MAGIQPNLWQRFWRAADFGLAVGYVNNTDSRDAGIAQTRLEQLGTVLCTPVGAPLHFTLREIRNPLMIVSLTVVAVGVVSIIFYPEEFRATVTKALPFVGKIRAWMIKATVYGLIQMTILGAGIRAFGRFNNPALEGAWRRGEIIPLRIGAKRVVDRR